MSHMSKAVCDGLTISANVLGIFFPAISYISHLHYSSLRAGSVGSTKIRKLVESEALRQQETARSNNTRRTSAAPYLQIDKFSRMFHVLAGSKTFPRVIQ